MKKISVLIPVYNGAAYLAHCVQSVCQQTYPHLDIVIVNDGSTDDTAQICEQLKQQDARIRVHHQPINQGIGASRNLAIQLAQGDYLVFVDSDDWIDPNHIQDLYDLLQRTKSDIAIANFTQFVDEKQAFTLHLTDEDYYEAIYSPQEWFRFQYGQPHYLSLCFIVPWGKIYRAQLFENVFYPSHRHADDDFTTWKLYLLADRIAYMHRSSYIYRVNHGSLTQIGQAEEIFSAQAVEERLSLLGLLGFDLTHERAAFRWRATMNQAAALKKGDMEAYHDLSFKLQLLDKYTD